MRCAALPPNAGECGTVGELLPNCKLPKPLRQREPSFSGNPTHSQSRLCPFFGSKQATTTTSEADAEKKRRRNRCQGRTSTAFNLPTSYRRGAGGCRCGEIMVISDAMDCQAFAANRIRSSRLAFNHRSIPSFTGRTTLAASHGLRGVQGSPSVPGNPLVLAAFSYLRAELVESQRAVTRSFFQVPTNALPSPGSLLRMYEDSSISPASSHYLCGLMLHWKDPERSGGSGGSGARGSERG